MSERDPDDNCLGQDLSNKENYGKQWENAEKAMKCVFLFVPFLFKIQEKWNAIYLPH